MVEKKIRTPKPGSKKAQSMQTQAFYFKLPKAYIHEKVIFLLYETTMDIKKSLGRAHHFYEKSILKGPLKGVNMPYAIYQEWVSLVTLEKEEEELHSILNMEAVKQCSYMIACLEKDKSTILHEWAHAHYFFNPTYRELIEKEWILLDPLLQKVIKKELEMRNYHPDVFLDEFQAYVRENPGDFGKKYTQMLVPLHLKLKSLIHVPTIFVADNLVYPITHLIENPLAMTDLANCIDEISATPEIL
jgi:primosomal protein N'